VLPRLDQELGAGTAARDRLWQKIALAIEGADIDAREFVAGENPFPSEALGSRERKTCGQPWMFQGGPQLLGGGPINGLFQPRSRHLNPTTQVRSVTVVTFWQLRWFVTSCGDIALGCRWCLSLHSVASITDRVAGETCCRVETEKLMPERRCEIAVASVLDCALRWPLRSPGQENKKNQNA
jgi:hypothetical protein